MKEGRLPSRGLEKELPKIKISNLIMINTYNIALLCKKNYCF